MNKIMLLSLVCMGFIASVPTSANALDSQVVSQNPHGEASLLIAQYRRNQNRDRQFSVYYRNSNDRQWTFEGYHNNRQDARRAANRLERRGYLTYVQVSREVNRGMNRG
jgi:hypothetical protein